MSQAVIVRPVNSLLFISDSNGGVAPLPTRGAMFLATASCISFCCYPEQDGPTEVVLGLRKEVDPGDPPSFKGDLETPNRVVLISNVVREKLLESRVPEMLTQVCIWLNHPRWPDKIIIGLG